MTRGDIRDTCATGEYRRHADLPSNDPTRQRARALAALCDEHFDVLVVGGGATGAGIVRDAATRGLRVAGVDAQDFASETSSHSSKLIHGGLRYLQHLDFGLVFEALRERRRLMRSAPHLCRPVEFMFPSYRQLAPGLDALGAGVALYNALALWQNPLPSRRLSRDEALAQAPGLRPDGLRGGYIYGDCQTNDARLVLETILDAQSAGAVALSRVRVAHLLRDRRGRVRAAHAQDQLTRAEFEIRATVIVNATGPFSDAFDRGRRNLRPTLGVHIVFDAQRLPHRDLAMVLRSPRDGRLVFLLPQGARTVLGTTDTDWVAPPLAASSTQGHAAHSLGAPPSPSVSPSSSQHRGLPSGSTPRLGDPIAARASDVEYLLDVANHAFPAAALTTEDVISTYAGLRPLVAAPEHTASSTSREHEIFVERDGLVTIVGGKLTTYRRMAEEATDIVVEELRNAGFERSIAPCSTGSRPLPGAATAADNANDASVSPLSRLGNVELAPDIETHLRQTYGARAAALVETMHESRGDVNLASRMYPDLPYVWAEVTYAVRHDLALDVEDVLRRRTNVFRDAQDQGAAVAETTANVLAPVLAWSPTARAQSVEAYVRAISQSTEWKESHPARR